MKKEFGYASIVNRYNYTQSCIDSFFHTFQRHGILPDHVEVQYYEGGHMMYTQHDELKQLAADIRTFLTR
ncbi:MAG: hypothetical protein ACRBG0_19685 [Lewinella sp.]|uniref:hypothetical protein n=1 Tax=Lewinella sp. TaxID=2004506 RepID=UPI003D6C0DC6